MGARVLLLEKRGQRVAPVALRHPRPAGPQGQAVLRQQTGAIFPGPELCIMFPVRP